MPLDMDMTKKLLENVQLFLQKDAHYKKRLKVVSCNTTLL